MQFNVSPAAPEFTFGASLVTSSIFGPFIGISPSVQTNDVDFSDVDGDGARITLHLPNGVAWTSTSGVFLPEPTGMAGLLAGLALLGGLAGMNAHRSRESRRSAQV